MHGIAKGECENYRFLTLAAKKFRRSSNIAQYMSQTIRTSQQRLASPEPHSNLFIPHALGLGSRAHASIRVILTKSKGTQRQSMSSPSPYSPGLLLALPGSLSISPTYDTSTTTLVSGLDETITLAALESTGVPEITRRCCHRHRWFRLLRPPKAPLVLKLAS